MRHRLHFVLTALVLATLTAGSAAAQQFFQADPLIVAVHQNKVDDVRALLVRGHSTEQRDGDGRTALIWGATAGNYDSLALLLDSRVRVDTADKYGNTALYYAAGNGHLETVELLLEHGATVDSENVEGRTPLMRAVEQGQFDTARTLIDRGADVDRADFTGRTVLDWARDGRSSRLVRLLEQAGAR